MDKAQEAREREAFEAWCKSRGREHSVVLKHDNGDYRNETARDEWRGWLAHAAASMSPPVAVRYRSTGGRWRYLNFPFTKGWEFPPNLGTPVYLYEHASGVQAVSPAADQQSNGGANGE